MTQDTQAGAGAQPAPAEHPEELRLAMNLRQRAQLGCAGNPDTLSAAGANALERQHAELLTARAEAKHWRSNHDNVLARLRIFTQRPDIPKELADRLPWYRELVRLQEMEAQLAAVGAGDLEPLQEYTCLGPHGDHRFTQFGTDQQRWQCADCDALEPVDAPVQPARECPQQSAAITDAEIDRIAESMPGGLDGFLKAWGWRQFARAILQAAPPAQALPSECDSPELCRVHRGCAGQYGTKNTCPSFAALNRCNSATPAQAVAVPAVFGDEDHVLVPRGLIGSACRAIDKKRDGAKTLAELRRYTVGDLSAAAPAQEHATQLAGQGQEAKPVVVKLVFVNGAPAACGCRHEFSSGGGEYSDVAYVHLCPTHVGVTPPIVLDCDWRLHLLDGTAIERDEMGCGEHPALPVLEEGMKPKQFFDALGIELKGVMAEDQMDMDAYVAMVEATDYNVWTPEAPAGDGWVLVAIFDTEDGPAAWWIRQAAPEQPARKNRKAAPAQAQEDARDALGQAVRDVVAEIERAQRKFPTWPTDPLHALAVLGEEFGELTKDVLQLTYEPGKTNLENMATEARQTAAMALRFYVSLPFYQLTPGVQHDPVKLAAIDAARAAQGGDKP